VLFLQIVGQDCCASGNRLFRVVDEGGKAQFVFERGAYHGHAYGATHQQNPGHLVRTQQLR
jgi:hypothetical protein